MYGITKLTQTAENCWRAKFRGNYGLYTINIITDGEKTADYSCTCPSHYDPCKHIDMVGEAIAWEIKKQKRGGKLQIENFIENVPEEKLREFIITQAKKNKELFNAILLEFTAGTGKTKGNKYSKIIRKILASVDIYEFYGNDENDEDEEYYDGNDYDNEGQGIDVLDQWLDKAWEYTDQKRYDEAVLISKAIVEEYSQWLYDIGKDAAGIFSSAYQSVPFRIMEESAEHINKKELFDYCHSEVKKKKYAETDFYNCFQELIEILK